MNRETSRANRNIFREVSGWRSALNFLPWLNFFSWFGQIRGDESLARLRDPLSLGFSVE